MMRPFVYDCDASLVILVGELHGGARVREKELEPILFRLCPLSR